MQIILTVQVQGSSEHKGFTLHVKIPLGLGLTDSELSDTDHMLAFSEGFVHSQPLQGWVDKK